MIDFAVDIKRSVSMRAICNMYGIKINRHNKAICPFHNDSHASLHVYDGDRGYWCFTCGEGGDVIDFVMQYFGLNFQSACEKINMDFHLGLPVGRKLSLRELREAQKTAKERKEQAEAEKAAYKRLKVEYQMALDKYCALDRQRIEYAPERLKCVVCDLYVEAIKNIPMAENALAEAEMRLYNYEHR